MNQIEVTVEQGTLRGSTGTDIQGNIFYKFQGIPYAKPPLGNLRFKAPLPPDKWSGIFNATKEGNPCYQRDPLKNFEAYGSEDCLYLNVYTKTLQDQNLKSVLVWIHGGGFAFGHSGEEYYGPEFLITEDIVLVTFNYRLGLLGFLNFDDPSLEIYGNAGLKDQVMALKWVHNNISKFGGDPNNVTIFGESAGAAAVHLHILSPMSKGLFHKAIIQSGCAIIPSLQSKSCNESQKILAEILTLEKNDARTIYEALMKKSKEEILEIQTASTKSMKSNKTKVYGVVVESNTKEPFIYDTAMNIIKSGKYNQVPIIIGFTSAEGMVYELLKEKNWKPNIEDMIPPNFGYIEDTPEKAQVAKKLKQFYFGDESISENNAAKKFDMLTDSIFIFPIYLTIKSHLNTSKSPIYLYKMSIETQLNFLKILLRIKENGASHLDDVGYLFKHFLTPEIKPGSIEEISIKRFVKLWTNFAKFGNPTPGKDDLLMNVTWKPVSGSNLDFLDIGKTLVPLTNPEAERILFWETLYNSSPAKRI